MSGRIAASPARRHAERYVVQPDPRGWRSCATDAHRLQADTVVARFDATDLDMHHVAWRDHTMCRRAVPEQRSLTGTQLRGDRGIVGSRTTHRVFDLGGQASFRDARTGMLARGAQTDICELSGTP